MLHNARLGFGADVKKGMNDARYILLWNKMTNNENDENQYFSPCLLLIHYELLVFSCGSSLRSPRFLSLKVET